MGKALEFSKLDRLKISLLEALYEQKVEDYTDSDYALVRVLNNDEAVRAHNCSDAKRKQVNGTLLEYFEGVSMEDELGANISEVIFFGVDTTIEMEKK